MTWCISCLNMIPDQGADVCPVCGFSASQYNPPLHWLASGTVLDNRYYIGTAAGSDVFGVLYNAYDVVMCRRVVIRQLMLKSRMPADNTLLKRDEAYFSAEQAEAFLKSFRNAADIEASCLPKVYTFRKSGNIVYAVTEYIKGESLAGYISSSGAWNFEGAKKLTLPVIIALKLLHDRGVVQGNLGPGNIIKTADSIVVSGMPGIFASAAGAFEYGGFVPSVSGDIRNFLLIFLSLMYGSDKTVSPAIINDEFFSRSEPFIPDDVKQYFYAVFHPEGRTVDVTARGVLDNVFKCGEVAVGRKQHPLQAAPPAFLLEAAKRSGVNYKRIITSVTEKM